MVTLEDNARSSSAYRRSHLHTDRPHLHMLSRTLGAHSKASLRTLDPSPGIPLLGLPPTPRSSPLPPEVGALLSLPSSQLPRLPNSFTGSLPSQPGGHSRGQRAGPSPCCLSLPRPPNAQTDGGLWGPGGGEGRPPGQTLPPLTPTSQGRSPCLPAHLPQEVPARLGSRRFQKGREACSWLVSPRVGQIAMQMEQPPLPPSALPDAVFVGDLGLLGR